MKHVLKITNGVLVPNTLSEVEHRRELRPDIRLGFPMTLPAIALNQLGLLPG